MTDKKSQPRKLSESNTKREMLEAYHELLKQLQEKQAAEVRPEEQMGERLVLQAVEAADSLSTGGIVQGIGTLKAEIGALLNGLSDRLDAENNKYRQIKTAVEAKEKELREIFEIQKSASSLAALIEAQHRQRQAFEAEMAARREELEREMQAKRAEWEREKQLHEAELQEREAAELKKREREREEYLYAFQREQQLARDRFGDQAAKLEREIQSKREELEREFAERGQAIARQEAELNELRQQVSAFPEKLQAAVDKAMADAIERAQAAAKSREDLLQKEFEGERNVLQTRIESLERTVKEQSAQIARLSGQLEKAYGQVQDIAVKALEGASHVKSLAGLAQMMAEPARRPAPEK
jgi:hypothetical protein